MKQSKMPPIGIIPPQFYWERVTANKIPELFAINARMNDLIDAIRRYIEVGNLEPVRDWHTELLDLSISRKQIQDGQK